jgi:hypothetical protein
VSSAAKVRFTASWRNHVPVHANARSGFASANASTWPSSSGCTFGRSIRGSFTPGAGLDVNTRLTIAA